MGRSQMQGTPWHYEYLHTKNKKKNSVNCVYNTGAKCTCSFSKNHNKNCVGENSCDDFERCSFSRPNLRNEAKYVKEKPYDRKNIKKQYNPKITVERGNTITIESVVTKEIVEFKVSDTKNPFYMKCINDVVLIKGEEYRIVKLEKR